MYMLVLNGCAPFIKGIRSNNFIIQLSWLFWHCLVSMRAFCFDLLGELQMFARAL